MAIRNSIADLFGTSPVAPLQAHMDKVLECVRLLPDFLTAAASGDWEAAAKTRASVVDLEHEADALKKALREKLPKNMIMAMDRRDVLQVLSAQDKIANRTKDITGLMLGRKLTIPPQITDAFIQFAQRSVEAVEQAHSAINELDELLDAGFSGHEVQLTQKLIARLNEIESASDELQIQLRADLLAIERELWPVDVMFLYQAIDGIGDLANDAQSVGSRLRLILAK